MKSTTCGCSEPTGTDALPGSVRIKFTGARPGAAAEAAFLKTLPNVPESVLQKIHSLVPAIIAWMRESEKNVAEFTVDPVGALQRARIADADTIELFRRMQTNAYGRASAPRVSLEKIRIVATVE
jgi:hypothetical protein